MAKRIEIYTTPEDFQQRLNDAGGYNRYDEPNFLVVWGSGGHSESTFRAGGLWSVDEASFLGYRDLLKTSGEEAWTLLQWHDPLEYGTVEEYYVVNYDEKTGLQTAGEYPYSGRYEVLYNMRYKEMTESGLRFEAMPLSNFLLETIIPIIIEAKDISYEKKKAAYEDRKMKEEVDKNSAVEQGLRDAALPFQSNAVSYARQGIRTPAIDRKVVSMSRRWDEITRRARQLKKGMTTSNTEVK